MSIRRSEVLCATAGVLALAAVLALAVALPAALAFLGGGAIGATSLAVVAVRVRLITGSRERLGRPGRLLAPLLNIPYYCLVAALLWALATYWRAQAPWLLAGYLLVLLAFALRMARKRPQGASLKTE